MSRAELDWAAGFIEGEGSFGYYSQSLVVQASQKTLWPLERLRDMFGGKIYGPTKSGVHIWRVSGENARSIMLQLQPLLSPRRQDQINKAIESRGEPKHNRDKTHCKHGHLLDGDNVRYSKLRSGGFRRTCRTCHKRWMKEARERVKESCHVW